MTFCKLPNSSSDKQVDIETGSWIALGKTFIEALAGQNFEGVRQLFQPEVRFRALVPSGDRQGKTDIEAAGWLEKWFGNYDTLQVQQSSVEMMADRLYLDYRFRLHNQEKNWQVIQQHAYCVVQAGQIADMWLVCSGFRPDLENSRSFEEAGRQAPQSRLGGDAFYDAGDRGCSEGPMDDIAAIMRRLQPKQTLEIYASDPSVARDLPAWCRLSGNEFVKQAENYYLLRHR
ncbi:MAG TPA: sulfurtransferase TusA family protein [Anaerolineaceae bacterium]|nr:sulfurtransferase TusA family protein [Anaerolineaceae bacterium]